jgi:hypothetical protein
MKRKRRGRPPKKIEETVDAHGFAPNLGVLAEECGVDQRTIHNARKRFAKDAPKKRLDGRYPVILYKQWLARHGVSGRRKDADLADERQVKLEHAKLRLERERFEFEQLKEQMLPVAQFELALTKTLSAFKTALLAFGPRINEQLEGRDYHDRMEIIDREIEVLQRTLAKCDYLEVEEENEVN